MRELGLRKVQLRQRPNAEQKQAHVQVVEPKVFTKPCDPSQEAGGESAN